MNLSNFVGKEIFIGILATVSIKRERRIVGDIRLSYAG